MIPILLYKSCFLENIKCVLVQPSMQAETNGRRNEEMLRQDDNQDDNQDRKVKRKTFDFLRKKISLLGVGVLVLVAAVISSAYSVQ